MSNQNYRVGIGYDIHRLESGRKLIIGGVDIPYEKGLLGHSDADVLVHAIIDALLGAAGLPDIGTLFPDTDPRYKDTDSMNLLKCVYEKISEQGYFINNIDSNIIAQEPKMMKYIPDMKKKISTVLSVDPADVSIKAKTKEMLDAVGQKHAIEANAVLILTKN